VLRIGLKPIAGNPACRRKQLSVAAGKISVCISTPKSSQADLKAFHQQLESS